MATHQSKVTTQISIALHLSHPQQTPMGAHVPVLYLTMDRGMPQTSCSLAEARSSYRTTTTTLTQAQPLVWISAVNQNLLQPTNQSPGELRYGFGCSTLEVAARRVTITFSHIATLEELFRQSTVVMNVLLTMYMWALLYQDSTNTAKLQLPLKLKSF